MTPLKPRCIKGLRHGRSLQTPHPDLPKNSETITDTADYTDLSGDGRLETTTDHADHTVFQSTGDDTGG